MLLLKRSVITTPAISTQVQRWLMTNLMVIACLFMFGSAYAYRAANGSKKIQAEVDTLNSQASALIRKDVGKAYTLLLQAEALASEYNYEKGLAVTLLNQAEVLNQRGYSKRALELYYRSMQLSQKNNDIYNIARAQQHVSTIKRKSGNYKEAELLLGRTLAIFTKLNKPVDMVNILLRFGLLNADQKKYKEALKFYERAYQLSRKVKYAFGEKKSYYNRALLLQKIGKHKEAIAYLHQALRIDTITNDTYGKALSYVELSRVYYTIKQYKEASRYAQLAYDRASEVEGLALVRTAVQLQINVSRALLDKDAIIQWQDVLLYVDNNMAEMERRESNNFIDALRLQEEQQLHVQQKILEVSKKSSQQKTLITLYTGFLVVFVIIVFLLSYSYKKARRYTDELNVKNKQIEQQLALLDKLNGEVLKQNEALEGDSMLKSRLLSIITHDLRKPLANTQSIIHLVNMDLVSQEEAQDLFAQLEAQYNRVMALTDNLLFWIRAQVSGTQLELAPVNMQHVLGGIIEEQKIPVNEKQINVVNKLPPDLNWMAEKETLRIMFRNLLNNAIKFTPIGGTITIDGHTDATTTNVTVTDTGIGMAKDVIERISQENYYTSKGTQNEEGSGFGLMLIRDLVKKQNGKLLIKSTPGQGSSFTISLPATVSVGPQQLAS